MTDLPSRFKVVKEGRLRALVRADVAAAVVPLLHQWCRGSLPPLDSMGGGRGGTGATELSPGLRVVVRPCRRGGMMSWINRDVYFGVRPRPMRELWVTERLRARAVPVVEALAAAVWWLAPGCYRGVFVSREIPGALNLWEYLQTVEAVERGRVCRAAAAATIRLHNAGVVHPDLNLQNYIVRRGVAGREVLIIDYDRVRFRRVSVRQRRAAFARLCRSIRRLDPESAVLTLNCVEALRTIELAESA